jgi:hypothetical protein
MLDAGCWMLDAGNWKLDEGMGEDGLGLTGVTLFWPLALNENFVPIDLDVILESFPDPCI